VIVENNVISCTPNKPHSNEDDVTIDFTVLLAPIKTTDSLRSVRELVETTSSPHNNCVHTKE
jgi:hypothetical protein